MSIGDWWRRRELWEQLLIVGVPGFGLGVVAGLLVDKGRQRRLDPGYTPYEDLPDLLDYESDEVDELPPPGIEYDENDAPCVGLPPEGVSEVLGEEPQFCTPPADLEPKPKTRVAFASGANRPNWPIDTNARRKLQVSYQDVRGKWHGRWGRHFGASRKTKSGAKRKHVGVDLFADPGDEVVAMEPGEIIAILPFYKGTSAVYLLTDSGIIVNYGELDSGSWRRYGLFVGKRVKHGDPLGQVGLTDDGSHMLHLETYQPDVTVDQIRAGKMRWTTARHAPPGILDPSRYLVRAQRVHYEQMLEQV